MQTNGRRKLAPRTLSRLNELIARDNRSFAHMSPANKRVQIARDVLEQIAMERFVPTTGRWLDLNLFIGDRMGRSRLTPETELQQVFQGVKECKGCAVGGLFMCAVKRANKLKVQDVNHEHEDEYGNPRAYEDGDEVDIDNYDLASGYLQRFFEEKQIEMIEQAFEHGGGGCGGADYDAVHFVSDVTEPAERMRLIMENIIVHKGEFVPSDLPEQTINYSTPGFHEARV